MRPEDRIQVDIVKWFRQTYPDVLITSTQAGMRRSKLGAIMMKRLGYTNGTPDLIIFAARKGWHALLIELKHKSAQSKDQLAFMTTCGKEGYWYVLAYGIDQAKDAINNYFSDEDIRQWKTQFAINGAGVKNVVRERVGGRDE